MDLIVDVFLIGGMVVNIIILLMLFKSKNKQLPQKLLMVFFASLFFFILHNYADVHELSLLFIFTFVFNDVIEFLIGPLIFIYIKSLFEDNNTLIKKNWIHFIPLLVYTVFISIPILISIIKDGFIFGYLRLLNKYSDVIFTFFMAYLIFYLCWSLQLFYKYRILMTSNFSTLSEKDFGWVKHMLIGSILVTSIDLITSIISIVFKTEQSLDIITLILVIILISYLGYYGVKQTKILLPDFLLQEEQKEQFPVQNTSVKQQLNEQELNQYKGKLLEIMEKEKAFLDEDLTLNKLAQLVGITDKRLSLLLNQYMDTTFYDFINKYRVASVKEKMASNDFENITLLGMAYESGFKSKTSFNRIFKKETGFSPSEYKKTL